MLKVTRHGIKTVVTNPVDGSKNTIIAVTFVEQGRSGAIASLSNSTDFLNRITGRKTGLDQFRTHTQPVDAEQIDLFPLGKEIAGHINRTLFSTPQMRQQEGVDSRMIDGKPTYFVTILDDVAKEDVDFRMSNEALIAIDVNLFRAARTGTAEVQVLQEVGHPAEVGTETLAD